MGCFSRCVLVALLCLPALGMAQERSGSWEFTVSPGVLYLDDGLARYLNENSGNAHEHRLVPSGTLRLGYHFNRVMGISGGLSYARSIHFTGPFERGFPAWPNWPDFYGKGGKYLSPFAAFSATWNLDAQTSPFLTGGTQITRVTGDGFGRHPVWGAHVGFGFRHFLNDYMALRVEVRRAYEHWQDKPGHKTSYNHSLSAGLSFFTRGRRCECVVLRDTLVLEGVNFDFDEATLTRGSRRVLDRVARALREPQWTGVRFEVAGHTSSIASAEYNLALSQRRAEAVRSYLVSRGVPDDRLVAWGYGETHPLVPNDREGYAWENRRVELRRMK